MLRAAVMHLVRWLGGGLLLPGALLAQTILVSDSFVDGSRFAGADPFDTSWYMSHPDHHLGGTAPGIGTDNNAPLSGNALGFGGTSTYAYGVGSFTPAALAVPGDSVTMTMSFAVQGATAANALYGPILGLFHDGGTPLQNDITALAGQATHNDVGYELIYERGLSGNLFLVPIDNAAGFTSDFAYGPRTPALTWNLGLTASDTGGHTLSLTLILAGNGTDLIAVPTLDGFTGTPQILTGANVPTTTFNEALISTWSGSTGFLDNVNVVFVPVPEPVSWALLTGGLGVAWMARRHRASGKGSRNAARTRAA